MSNDVDSLHKALAGGKGALDEWLEIRNEQEVRDAILAAMSPAETLRGKFVAKALPSVYSALPHDVAAPLREAEAQIAIAFSRLSKLGPGGLGRYGWAGSWAEYQKIGQLLCKTRTLSERIERYQYRVHRNTGNAGGGEGKSQSSSNVIRYTCNVSS